MSGNVLTRTAEEIGHWLRPKWTVADVAAHWDATEDYDELNAKTVSYFRRFVDGLRLSDIPEGSRVLDICARTANGTLYFHQNGKVASAVCMEVSDRMGEVGRKRLTESGFDNFKWIKMLDYSVPYDDEEFDAVLCFETVEHFSEPEKLVAELWRVTRPGGTMILTTPNVLWEPVHAVAAITGMHHSEGPHRFIRFGRLKRMVRDAGFTVERSETAVLVPGGPAPLVKLGDRIERMTRSTLMPWLGLRRMLICKKAS